MLTAWEKILRKTLVGSNIDSSRWNSIQAAVRDRAFFSSTVAEMNILDAARKLSKEYAEGGRDLSSIRMELRDYLENTARYVPGEDVKGTIKDLTSKARLDAIVKTNVAQARGFVQYADGMTPGAFAAFPAQEFVRVRHSNTPRGDWPQRWKNAGGRFYAGRMIAAKDDPVWTRLSVFGQPYPPFDWGSGMGVMDVSRKEAIELGVMTEGEIREKRDALREKEKSGELPSMNGNLQAEVPAVRDVVSRVKADFGDLADVVRVDDKLKFKWRPEILKETVMQKEDFRVECGIPQQGMIDALMSGKTTSRFADEIKGKQLVVDQAWRDQKRSRGGTHLNHFYPMENQPDDIPLKPEDLEVIPSMWRKPTRTIKIGGDLFAAELDMIDGSTYLMQIKVVKDKIGNTHPKLWAFYHTTNPTSKKLGRKAIPPAVT